MPKRRASEVSLVSKIEPVALVADEGSTAAADEASSMPKRRASDVQIVPKRRLSGAELEIKQRTGILKRVPKRSGSVGRLPRPLQNFTLVWTSVMKRKISVSFSRGPAKILRAEPGKAGWVIVKAGDEEVGVLVPRESHTRFSYYVSGGKAELFGIVFTREPVTHCRCFRLVMATDPEFMPTAHDDELSRVAKAGKTPENVIVINSALPAPGPDGALTLRFGDVHVVASSKNFVVEDDAGQTTFSVYRTGDDTCGVVAVRAFEAHVAFAIALSAVLNES
jgi:hypothetical protein